MIRERKKRFYNYVETRKEKPILDSQVVTNLKI
jgi:hypothetical protein